MPSPEPIPFTEALERILELQALPTNMGTAELRELARVIRERSLFSARTSNEVYLEKIREVVHDLLGPVRVFDPEVGRKVTKGMNLATARLELKKALDSIDYIPDQGKAGTIQDLRSDQRLNLVLKTQTQQAQSVGQLRKLQDPDLLEIAPALELTRFMARREPRDWVFRFRLAGQASGRPLNDGWTITPTGRMVALVNHPIWEKLGSPALFDDAIGTTYPPFAFNSGMNWLQVDVDEAEDLGILNPNNRPKPQSVSIEEAFTS